MVRERTDYIISRIILLTVLFILLVLPVIIRNPYYLHILIMILLGSIFAVSLRLTWVTMIFNLGHAAFAAIGAYSSVLLVMRLGLSFWAALPLAGILAAICATILGYITLRVGGIYFLIITLVFNEVIRLSAISWASLTGGWTGIPDIPHPLISILGVQIVEFTSKVPYYYLILILFLITLIVCYRIDMSRFGATLRSIAESETLSESVGINVLRCKVAVFSIGSFFSGVGGSFYAHYFGLLTPNTFSMYQSFDYFFYVYVGGAATIFGPVIGAALLIIMLEVLRGAVTYKMISYAVILLLIARFLPTGVESLPIIINSKIGRLLKRS